MAAKRCRTLANRAWNKIPIWDRCSRLVLDSHSNASLARCDRQGHCGRRRVATHIAQCLRGHLKNFAAETIVDIPASQPVDHSHMNSGYRFEFRRIAQQRVDENISSSFAAPQAVK